MTPRICLEETTAETGTMPPTSALPRMYMSGTTLSSSQAKVVPVRPSPDWISSAMNSTFASVHSARTAGRYSGGGTITPASPCTGSISTATVWEVTAARIVFVNESATTEKPGVNGPKPALATSSVEKLTIVVV